MASKVSKVNSQLSVHWYSCQTTNLLQTQPVFSFHISKPILIFCPPSLKVLWPITSSLEHGPAPSVLHVAPDREGPPTTWIYGVHSWPSAAQDIGLLAVKGEGVQVSTADCRGDSIIRWWPCSSLLLCSYIVRSKQVYWASIALYLLMQVLQVFCVIHWTAIYFIHVSCIFECYVLCSVLCMCMPCSIILYIITLYTSAVQVIEKCVLNWR